MAKGGPKPQNVSEALRDAVARTLETTVGSTRGRAQEAVDEILRGAEASAGRVRSQVRSAEAGAGAVRDRVRDALEDVRPASVEDLRGVHRELRAIARRLEGIETKLAKIEPAARTSEPDPPKGTTRSTRSKGGTRSGGTRSAPASPKR
jgi:vacuolar-type H+-ATPase subunit E/Vma4